MGCGSLGTNTHELSCLVSGGSLEPPPPPAQVQESRGRNQPDYPLQMAPGGDLTGKPLSLFTALPCHCPPLQGTPGEREPWQSTADSRAVHSSLEL